MTHSLSSIIQSSSRTELRESVLHERLLNLSPRRNSLNSSLRQSLSESNAQVGSKLHNPKTVGEHIRREKEKYSQKNIRKCLRNKEDELKKIIEFLNQDDLDPERMLSAIKSEETTAKSRVAALQHVNDLIGNGFIDSLTRMASRAFLAAVFGLIQNPLEANSLDMRLSHYLCGIENARPSLQHQVYPDNL